MKILVCPASGRTGKHVIEALQRRPETPTVLALSRNPAWFSRGVESFPGDLEDAASMRRAMAGVDVVVYYGPALHSREIAMGTAAIDAAVTSGVKRFVFISVIHPQIDDLMNHQAKLAIEAYLINSGIDWTILRPQHYMQNIDVPRVLEHGFLAMPYAPDTVLGHVDMADLAEAAAKVAVETGHDFASYDISSNERLSVHDICASISKAVDRPIEARAMSVETFLELVKDHYPLNRYSKEAFHRLFGYYERNGISGNQNVLTWLLGREPTSFAAYVGRHL